MTGRQSRTAPGCGLVLLAWIALAACTPASPSNEVDDPVPTGVHVVDCAVVSSRDDAITILSGDHYGVGGWKHVNGIEAAMPSRGVTFDPAHFGDQWVRIRIPREELTFYTEANFERTPASDTDYQDHHVRGLRINPETTSGLVARHFIGDGFDPLAQPELFKEMHLTFALIEVGWSGP